MCLIVTKQRVFLLCYLTKERLYHVSCDVAYNLFIIDCYVIEVKSYYGHEFDTNRYIIEFKLIIDTVNHDI